MNGLHQMNATSKKTAATTGMLREVEPAELRTIYGGIYDLILGFRVYFATGCCRLPPGADPSARGLILVP